MELGRAHGSPLLETFPAKNRAPLGWPERYRGFLSALRTTGLGLRTDRRGASSSDCFGAFGFTGFAALGLVLEAFVCEKHLFAGGKYEFGPALRALQNLVVVFHESVPPWTPSGGNAQTCARWAEKTDRDCLVQGV